MRCDTSEIVQTGCFRQIPHFPLHLHQISSQQSQLLVGEQLCECLIARVLVVPQQVIVLGSPNCQHKSIKDFVWECKLKKELLHLCAVKGFKIECDKWIHQWVEGCGVHQTPRGSMS